MSQVLFQCQRQPWPLMCGPALRLIILSGGLCHLLSWESTASKQLTFCLFRQGIFLTCSSNMSYMIPNSPTSLGVFYYSVSFGLKNIMGPLTLWGCLGMSFSYRKSSSSSPTPRKMVWCEDTWILLTGLKGLVIAVFLSILLEACLRCWQTSNALV